MQALKERLKIIDDKLILNEKKVIESEKTDFYESVEEGEEGNFVAASFYCGGGRVKIESENVDLYINGVPVVLGEYFELEKGEYLLKGLTDLEVGSVVKIVFYGDVKNLTQTKVKGVNFDDESYLLSERKGEFNLYKYSSGEITRLASEQASGGDICKGDALYLAFLKNGVIEAFKYSSSVFSSLGSVSGEDFLCDYDQKLTLYVVKSGKLYLYTLEKDGFSEQKTLLKADKLYAVKGEKIVYRDLRGDVRLSFNIPKVA